MTTDKESAETLPPGLKIEFEETQVIGYGCGDAAYAVFKVRKKADQDMWYKTEVVEVGSDKVRTYYLQERNGLLQVGHGMCSGAFKFKRKAKYKVRFTPMNVDGQPLRTTKWIAFDSPYMNQDGILGG